MITSDDIISILQIRPNMIDDGELDKYIKRYTLVIMSELGEWAKKDENLMNDPLFEECLLAIIACQLTRTKIEMIHSPSEYKVGDILRKTEGDLAPIACVNGEECGKRENCKTA